MPRFHFPLTALAAVLGSAVLLSATPAQAYTWFPYNGHTYALTNAFGTWQQAEAEAVAAGGHLITINDAAENAFAYDTFVPLTHKNVLGWIGFNQTAGSTEPGQGWVWSSGETVTYTNWASGEPNNLGGAENWAVFSSPVGGVTYNPVNGWLDLGPTSSGYASGGYQGIIEVAPEPSSLAILGIAAIGAMLRSRRRARA